jgi:hypothetical protein
MKKTHQEAYQDKIKSILQAKGVAPKPKVIIEMIDKLEVASSLRSAIEHYTELTVNEHMSGKITKDADMAWKKIENLISKLTGETK